jgi:hypothetical protein
MIMKIVEAQGYSKDKALKATGLDVELEDLKNATQLWKRRGSPVNSKELNKFMADYIKENKVVGAYIVVEPSTDDSRLRPYSVINEATHGKRKTRTTYQIKEASFKTKRSVVKNEEGEEKEVVKVEVLTLGAVEARAEKKDIAVKTMKELIEANKKDYVIEIVKEVTEGQKYAAYGQYTPSKSAKMGKFIFFTRDN